MRARLVAPALTLAASILGSCSDDGKTPAPTVNEKATLETGIVARVSGETISATLVASVAAHQHVSPEEALHELVDDAIAAQAARMRRLDRVPPARWRLTTVRARLMTDKLREAAVTRGEPTKEEVDELTLRHWQEVDRAVAALVVHAIVLRPKDPSAVEAAREEAKKLQAILAATSTPEEFRARASAFTVPPPLTTRVEDLPPFIEEDGWITVGKGQMDATFARAAHALGQPGDTSGVVETKHGFHVIRLLEKIPEQRVSYEARRSAFTDETYANRSRKGLEALLEQLRAKHTIAISTSAEELMRSVHREPERAGATP